MQSQTAACLKQRHYLNLTSFSLPPFLTFTLHNIHILRPKHHINLAEMINTEELVT